jgi:hypothetical protein
MNALAHIVGGIDWQNVRLGVLTGAMALVALLVGGVL